MSGRRRVITPLRLILLILVGLVCMWFGFALGGDFGPSIGGTLAVGIGCILGQYWRSRP
jgi:hypothetical protein